MASLYAADMLEHTQCVTIKNHDRTRFFYEDADYQHYLHRLKIKTEQYACYLHAYALMPDHVQLLLSYGMGIPVVKALEQFERDYAQYFNITHRRIRRNLDLEYALAPVDTEKYALTYYRYIELAPVRMQLTEHPSDYPWTSYGCNAMGEDIGLISPHAKYLALGTDEPARRKRYRELFQEYKSF